MDSRVNAGKKRADRAEGKGPGATQRGEEGATSGVNMLETVEGQRKKQSVGAVFAREWGRANALLMVGFALCQCWITLCFFAPQLFPDNQSTNVYELSLLVTAVALVPGVAASRRMEAGGGSCTCWLPAQASARSSFRSRPPRARCPSSFCAWPRF